MHSHLVNSAQEGGEQLSLTEQDGETSSSPHDVHILELSDELRGTLKAQGFDDESISDLLKVAPNHAPPQDDSYPLSCYYVSTSHNTYLLSGQLLGTSSPTAYTRVISKGCRCVEIDAWDSNDGPIVTHGLTLTQSTPFRAVCEAINEAVNDDDWPLMISLECHADSKRQLEMVRIMKEVWGSRLVDQRLEGLDGHVYPKDLKGRILLIVEYYYPPKENDNEDGSSTSSSSSSDSSSSSAGFLERLREKRKQRKVKPRIIPELASLGIYANSIKPKKGFLSKPERADPLHQFLNLSESAIKNLIPTYVPHLVARGTKHQLRIYPKGTRIRSNNFNPAPYWRAGGQVSALNWQRFDQGMQINRAMFEGSGGWILKPPSLLGSHRKGTEPPLQGGLVRYTSQILGISGVELREPVPQDEKADVYVLAEFFHADGDRNWRSTTVRSKLDDARRRIDAVWSEDPFEWSFNNGAELTFLRFLVVRNIRLAKDKTLAIFCVKMDNHEAGLKALPLLDPSGRLTNASLLIRSTLQNV